MRTETTARSTSVARQAVIILAVVALVTIAGLTYVKWWPYYNRIIKALSTHTIGGSMFGNQGYFQASSFWGYTLKYFKAVWQAALLGIVLGGAAEALLPANWVERYLSGRNYRSTLLGGVSALPGMMCTCCVTPVVVGLRKKKVSTGASLAFWMGNPALNPATLTILFLVLGWQFGIIRLLLAAVTVFGVSYLIDRLFPDEEPQCDAAAPTAKAGIGVVVDDPQTGHWAVRWLKASGRLALWLVPEYLVVVTVTSFLGGYFFPSGIGAWSHSLIALVLIAVAGTLFVIPTMAEIPIVQGLIAIGLPAGPAMALLLTLPTISLPSLLMAGRSFRSKTLVTVAGSVAAMGIIGGLIAMAFM